MYFSDYSTFFSFGANIIIFEDFYSGMYLFAYTLYTRTFIKYLHSKTSLCLKLISLKRTHHLSSSTISTLQNPRSYKKLS